MAIYSKGFAIQTLTAGAASFEIYGIAQDRTALLGLLLTLTSAPGAASTFGFGVPAAIGQGPTLQAMNNEDGGALADLFPTMTTAWVTSPTAPTQFLRRFTLDNVVGQGQPIMFPRGLNLTAGSSFVLWNITAVGNTSINLIVDD